MYDYHLHTSHSDDSLAPMDTMIEAAIDLGLSGIAITDHYDPDYPTPEFPFTLDFSVYHSDLLEASERYRGKIKIAKGIEIGIQHGETMEKCRAAATSWDYDFILGSFHCAHGKDLCVDYFDNIGIYRAYERFYSYMYDCLLLYKDFDVLSHFNIIDRYTSRIPEYDPFMEQIEAILKLLIDEHKGIEINTSSFRYGLGDVTTPSTRILRLYSDLGGRILTLGSDAHNAGNVGYMLDWARDFAISCGFKYVATYENRVPSFELL